MKGAEIKILDPDKEGVGEVLIRGTMVFSGYYKNPTATAERLRRMAGSAAGISDVSTPMAFFT
jgi:long-subunit acyl-CoA synthetase (AMP-forming)